MIKQIEPDHDYVQCPAMHNVYPLVNEFGRGAELGDVPSLKGELYVDTRYGRMFTGSIASSRALYGKSESMAHYVGIRGLDVVDELRVPYRKIPVYRAPDVPTIASCVQQMTAKNSAHQILLRGQGNVYLLPRDEDESRVAYGEPVREPSFLPSFLRADFEEFSMRAIWHNQAAMLLNDVGVDLEDRLSTSDCAEYWKDARQLRAHYDFDAFALGVAQHYGLPSVGLDLTDDLQVALWFALFAIDVDKQTGRAISQLVGHDAEPTLFVLRCPGDAVFDWRRVRPKHLPDGRPDRQGAWFAHVGWGAAENQLASYLMCGFRLSPDLAEILPDDFESALFPSQGDDLMLQYFWAMKGLPKLEGEVRRALARVYAFV